MGRKPAPGLPDVFAKPGGAPARGISLEDLPTTADDKEAHEALEHEAPEADPIPEPIATASAAATSAAYATSGTSGSTPSPAPAPSHSPADPAHGPTVAAAEAATTGEAPGRRTRVPAIVWVVLIASLTAPLWEGTVLSGLGIHTPSARSAARNTTALEQQDARLTTLEQRLTSTTTQLDAMRANLTLAIQRATDATSQARAVALLRLADALRGAAPFATELAVVRATGSDTGKLQPALTQLAPYATTGAPTIDQLQRELRVLYDSVARAVRQANPASWTDLMNWAGLSGTQPPAQIDPNLRAARLGLTRLAVGDVTGAIEQANQVDGAYQTDFADWTLEANARLAADTALREIDTLVARPAGTP
jgi:hypothetical protein